MIQLRDRKLKERLQLTLDLTLTKALEIARQDEQLKQQMREQNNEASNEEDEARMKFEHRDLTKQAIMASKRQPKQIPDYTEFQNRSGRG